MNKLTTTTSALDVARYLLSLDPPRKYFTKKHGNFRLNTMLHICQTLHYAKYGKPLFKEDLIAVSRYFWEDKEEQRALKARMKKQGGNP